MNHLVAQGSLALALLAFSASAQVALPLSGQFLQAPEIREYVQKPYEEKGGLKSDLADLFFRLDMSLIQDASTRSQVSEMVRGGMLAEISLSTYVAARACRDSRGVSQPSSTEHGSKWATICFGLSSLGAVGVTKAELIGLAAHEHAAHFGFNDTNPDGTHPIGIYFANLAANSRAREPKKLEPSPIARRIELRFEAYSAYGDHYPCPTGCSYGDRGPKLLQSSEERAMSACWRAGMDACVLQSNVLSNEVSNRAPSASVTPG